MEVHVAARRVSTLCVAYMWKSQSASDAGPQAASTSPFLFLFSLPFLLFLLCSFVLFLLYFGRIILLLLFRRQETFQQSQTGWLTNPKNLHVSAHPSHSSSGIINRLLSHLGF